MEGRMKIAVLGQGAMGSRMAVRLVAAGHAVVVWNRTPREGSAESVATAVAGAEVVLSMLRDDAASAVVWAEAMPAMAKGAVGIEASTISHTQARALHDQATARGIALLDAPVAGSRPQAEAGQLIFMAGGKADVLEQVTPVLLTMGGAVHHAGGPGAGAMVKLMVNTLFGTQVAVMAELVGLARKAGINAGRAVEVIGATPVASAAAKGAAAAMLAGAFAPAFPIDLVEKDFGLATTEGIKAQAALPLATAAQAVFAGAKVAGFGADNITGVMQLYG
jgi:3-hydroxyisobutyrate dehydrogenase